MRASEFLIEKRVGKIGNRRQAGTRGLTKFRDVGGYDRTYELNRVMMAVACADGTGATLELDEFVDTYRELKPGGEVWIPEIGKPLEMI